MKGLDEVTKNKLLSSIPEEFKYTIVKCIFNAVGDDIKEDIKRNRLDMHNNGDANRIWDFINRELKDNFLEQYDTVVSKTKRGPWIMSPVFERKTGTLVTLMREARYKELKKGSTMHYVKALASCLNDDIIPNKGEQTLFDICESDEEKEEKKKITKKILDSLCISSEIVEQYAVVLFESNNYELISLRCCILNGSLEIIDQENWNMYIPVKESSVVEQIDNENELSNHPNRGISLKDKAIDKKGQKRNLPRKSLPEEKEEN